MSTKRLLIRNAVVKVIKEAVAGVPVYVNLDYALDCNTLPAVVVSSLGDEVTDTTGSRFASGAETIVATFSVSVLIAQSDDPETDADALENAIRLALRANPSLDGTVNVFRYAGGEWEFDLGDCAVRKMTFKATYIS